MATDARGSNRFMINLLSIELLLHRNLTTNDQTVLRRCAY